MFLVGEPGIGKTRTAEEFVDEAAQHVVAVRGHCYEWEGAPPYWPWIQILKRLARQIDLRMLCDSSVSSFAAIAQIIPELREHIPDLSIVHEAPSDQSRFQLFSAVTTLVKQAAAQRPLVIMIDDLHWADEPSLLMLQFLAQEIRDAAVLVVGTYRAVDMEWKPSLARILAEINRVSVSHRIILHGLPRVDVARFIERQLDEEPPASLIDAVYSETEGNPFFVTEVVRLLASEGKLRPPVKASSWRIRIPESVRAVVERRLDRLSNDCLHVLQIASVFGREFSVTQLEQGFDLSSIDVLNAVDEAAAAKLVDADDRMGHYRFSHALVKDTLYRRLSTARRASLHRRVAETLQRSHGHDPSFFAMIAHHFSQALPAGVASHAVEFATKAGDRSMAQIAWESAVGHYQRALQALDWLESIDQLQRCDLLLSLGDAYNRSGPGSGDSPEARAAFQEAADIARQLGEAERFARATIGYAGFNTSATFGGLQQIGLLEEALTLLSEADSPLRVRVLSRLTQDLAILHSSPRPRIRTLGNEAVNMARRIGDRETLALALSARHLGSWGPDNIEERMEDATELIALAEQHGHPLRPTWEGYWGCINLMLDLVEFGDISRAEGVLAELEILSGRFRVPYVTLRAVVYRAMFHLMRGRYAEAEPLVERAKQQWQSEMLQQHVFQAFALRREQGRLEELNSQIEGQERDATSAINRYHHLISVHRLILLVETSRELEARALFETIARGNFDDVPQGPSWHGVIALLSEACVKLGDITRAEVLYDLLIPYAELNVVLSVNAVYLGSAAHYLGLLATTLSRWDNASRHFRTALEMYERSGMRPYAARTRFDLAAMLDKQNDGDGRRESRLLVERALNDAHNLGMLQLQREATTLAESLDTAGNAKLSPRETDVMRLIAHGLTDAEIAERLGISPRTVNTHVRSVFAKLDVPSRAAATRTALEQNLI